MKYVISFLILSFFVIETASSQVTVKVGDSVVVYRFNSLCPVMYSNPFNMTKSKTGLFGFADLSDSTGYDFGFYFKPTARGIYKDTISATYWCVDMQNDYMTGMTYFLEAIATDTLNAVQVDASSLLHMKVLYSTNSKPQLLLASRSPQKVIIEIVDILGNTVQVLTNEVMDIGEYYYSLDLSSGIYFARLQTNSCVSSVKILIP